MPIPRGFDWTWWGQTATAATTMSFEATYSPIDGPNPVLTAITATVVPSTAIDNAWNGLTLQAAGVQLTETLIEQFTGMGTTGLADNLTASWTGEIMFPGAFNVKMTVATSTASAYLYYLEVVGYFL